MFIGKQKKLLLENKEKLRIIAEALLEKETLTHKLQLHYNHLTASFPGQPG